MIKKVGGGAGFGFGLNLRSFGAPKPKTSPLLSLPKNNIVLKEEIKEDEYNENFDDEMKEKVFDKIMGIINVDKILKADKKHKSDLLLLNKNERNTLIYKFGNIMNKKEEKKAKKTEIIEEENPLEEVLDNKQRKSIASIFKNVLVQPKKIQEECVVEEILDDNEREDLANVFAQMLKNKKPQKDESEKEQPKKSEKKIIQDKNKNINKSENSNQKPKNKFSKIANKVLTSKKAFSVNKKLSKPNPEKKKESINLPSKFLKTNPEKRSMQKNVPRLQKSKSQSKILNKSKSKTTENIFLTKKFAKIKKKLGILNLYLMRRRLHSQISKKISK